MKKNNVNPNEDYNFDNDSLNQNNIDLDPEELEGAMDYYDDLINIIKEQK